MARICSIIFLATAWFWVSCVSYPRIPASGEVAGKPIITTVDSSLAKRYLKSDLGGRGQNHRLGNQTARIDERYRAAALDRQTLKAISNKTSPDFAALFLVKQLLSNPRN